VTLRIREAVSLHQTIDQMPIDDVADALIGIASGAEWVKVWWLPHSRTAQVVRYAVTTEPHSRRPSPATRRWIDERVMHRFAFPAMVRLQHRRPATTAGLNQWLSARYLGPPSQVGPGSLMLNTPMPIRHRETEAAVPMTVAPDALRGLLALFRDGRPAVNFPLEIRFVRGDEAWLSPAQGADTCQIGAYTTDGPDCSSFFAGVWRVMRPLGARPHWGKELDHTVAEIRTLYPHLDRFTSLRDDLDPDRVFAGAFLEQVLGA
jgi:FAD/FMN-containing dehydrogenase